MDTARTHISLSEANYKMLRLWAYWHGKSPANYAAQIVAARIEANLPTIQALVEQMAYQQGITAKEMEEQILSL